MRLAFALPLAGCAGGPMDPQGPVAAADRLIMFNAVVIMLAIVVPTIVAALVFAWWFRASNPKAVYRPDFTYSGRIEVAMWFFPIMIILFLGGVIWAGSHDLDPAEPLQSSAKPVNVQVVSMDWKWLFIYPDQGIATVNQLTVPAQVPVHFYLTSASVMNTFFVPQLGSMIYTMNRMVTQLNLQADHPGDYFGESTMISGDGYSDMTFYVHAVPADQFATWISDVQKSGPTLDDAAYRQLSEQNSAMKPQTYRAVAPDLFKNIANQNIPPSPGPSNGRGGPGVRPQGAI